ncbi:gamma-glutamyltransferase [Pseudohaliea sp.]|uniref:gamma-glutamyltransferase n=1 Tax=Pseudohaliea sp. TaxID=2740289 RepID=UPI0032F04438
MDRRAFLGAAAMAAASPWLARAAEKAWQPAPNRIREALLEQARFQGYKQGVSGNKGVAVSTHPLATKAAIDAIKAGGNAVDAICAAALMQTVVEPHMTTITGVFSMLYYEAATGKSYYINGTNARPLNCPDLDLSKMAQEMGTADYVCVPGYWAGWQGAHDRFGKLSRKRVMAPSIHYAREGFEIHPFLFGEVFVEIGKIASHAEGREVFMPNKTIVQPGDRLYQKRYADLLEQLSEEGSGYFYHGGFAEKFSKVIQAAGGSITPEDFAQYEAFWDEPAKGAYRDYQLLASPPPDFGATDVAAVLQILQHADIGKMGAASESPETCHLMFKALDEVWADTLQANHSGEPQHWQQRLDPDLAARRYEKLSKGPARSPSDVLKVAANISQQNIEGVTTGSNHLSVVDGEGNVATVLHSCMALPWANGLFIDGTSICGSGVHYSSGMPERGAHFHSRIVPLMVLKDGKPVIACGSPSVSLYENLVQNVTNIIDCGMSIEESVNRPRFGGSWGMPARLIEQDMGAPVISALMEKDDVALDIVNPRQWLHGSFEGIHIQDGMTHACGDPRRTAVAMAV